MYVIYALIDPRDNTVRYVGITDDVYKRFLSHIQCSGSNYAKNAWIHELRSFNKMVIMETLEEIEDRASAQEREQYWIQHFQFLQEPLANINKTVSARKAKKTNLRTGKYTIKNLMHDRVVDEEARTPSLRAFLNEAGKIRLQGMSIDAILKEYGLAPGGAQ